MAIFLPARVLVFSVLVLTVGMVAWGFPATMTLNRTFSNNHRVELSQLRARDKVRHGRMLQTSNVGVIDFPIAGSFNPSLVGLYYTTVKLGSPPTDFYVQIDTGSNILWISCSSCIGCPSSSSLKIQLNPFDVGSSSTASSVSCSDRLCSIALQSDEASCSATNNQCIYEFEYGDGSGTSGYYVSDLLHFDTVLGESVITNSSASIVFGCSTSVTGDLMEKGSAVNGIFGFGPQGMSVISQLSSQGIAPKVFSHCLKGDDTGGGVLVLGEIVEPNIVYSPLVPSQAHYNLNLQDITVNGKTLSIDSSVFSTSSNLGTVVDSGTTLAYLAKEAYDPFINAITDAVSQYVKPVATDGFQCYVTTSSSIDVFPRVSFNFAGGASMVLGPVDYLLQQNSVGGAEAWCIGFQKIQDQDVTILGDLVLKDKIVVYDLAAQRIGWANYDCSKKVKVTANISSGTESANMGPRGISNALRNEPHQLITLSITTFLMLISMLYSYLLL